MENVDSINYLRQKIEVIQKSFSDVRIPISENVEDEKSDSLETTTYMSTTNTERLDSIKSLESILKILSFETKEFNKKNEKCIEFWKLIDEHPEIHPINCVIMDAYKNKRDCECQTEQQESEASLWVRALHELMKRNLHHVATATSGNTCKYCKYPHDSYEVSTDDDQLSELNDFSPRCPVFFPDPTPSKQSSDTSSSTKKCETIKLKRKSTDVSTTKHVTDIDDTLNQRSSIFSDISHEMSSSTVSIVEKVVVSDVDSSYYSTKKDVSVATFDRSRKVLSSNEGVHVVESINQEISRRLSQAVEKLQEREITGKKSQNLAPAVSIFSSGIMDSWRKPPIGKDTKLEWLEQLSESVEEYEQQPEQQQQDDEKQHSRVVRDNYNYVQNTLSLLHIDHDEYVNSTAEDRKKMLQAALKENYSKFVKRDPDGPKTLPCPCDKKLQAQTKSYCSCESGICKVLEEPEVEDLKDLTKFMPYGKGVECIMLMLEGLKKIRAKLLTIEETSAEVRQLLLSIQTRDMPDGPCKCPLHRIDFNEIAERLEEAKYTKDALYENLEGALNQKYGEKLGERFLKKVKDECVQAEPDVESNLLELDGTFARVCEICDNKTCKCGKSKYRLN